YIFLSKSLVIFLRGDVMLLRGIFAAFSLLIISATAMADSVDVNLRNNSAQFQYIASMGHDTLGKAEMHAGVIYVNQKNLLGDLGILVKDEVGKSVPGLSVGVGIKGLTAKTNGNNSLAPGNNMAALAIGGMVRYAPFPDRRFGIVGQLYLSPNIVTFGDADRYTETGVRFEYEIIPQAAAYLGYRRINFGLKSVFSDVTLDEGAFLGVRIMF
ncbi:MAG: YfaZ family outer membrane protein, partial [Burkholderiales bacterium]